jgi:antitoxin HicB
MFCYPVILEEDRESHQVLVDFIDLPFVHAIGDNAAEALLNAVDALETAFDVLMQNKEIIPAASSTANHSSVAVPVLIAAKVALHNAMISSGLHKADLARKLNIQPNLVERLLSLRYKSRIEQLETALALFDKRLLVDVR